jgi:hypothetical protein
LTTGVPGRVLVFLAFHCPSFLGGQLRTKKKKTLLFLPFLLQAEDRDRRHLQNAGQNKLEVAKMEKTISPPFHLGGWQTYSHGHRWRRFVLFFTLGRLQSWSVPELFPFIMPRIG